MSNIKLIHTADKISGLIKYAWVSASRRCRENSYRVFSATYSDDLDSRVSDFLYSLPSYLLFDKFVDFLIQPSRMSHQIRFQNHETSIRINLEFYTPAKVPLDNSTKIELILNFYVDRAGQSSLSIDYRTMADKRTRTNASMVNNTELHSKKVMKKADVMVDVYNVFNNHCPTKVNRALQLGGVKVIPNDSSMLPPTLHDHIAGLKKFNN